MGGARSDPGAPIVVTLLKEDVALGPPRGIRMPLGIGPFGRGMLLIRSPIWRSRSLVAVTCGPVGRGTSASSCGAS